MHSNKNKTVQSYSVLITIIQHTGHIHKQNYINALPQLSESYKY